MKKFFFLIIPMLIALALTGCSSVKDLKSAQIGDTIMFGKHLKKSENCQGKTYERKADPIEWYIIDIDENRGVKLAFCKHNLCFMPFQDFLPPDISYGNYEDNIKPTWIYSQLLFFNEQENNSIKGTLFDLDESQVIRYLNKEMKVCELFPFQKNILKDLANSAPDNSDYFFANDNKKKYYTGTVAWWIKPKNSKERDSSFQYITHEGKLCKETKPGNMKIRKKEVDLVRNKNSSYLTLNDLSTISNYYKDWFPIVRRPAMWIKYDYTNDGIPNIWPVDNGYLEDQPDKVTLDIVTPLNESVFASMDGYIVLKENTENLNVVVSIINDESGYIAEYTNVKIKQFHNGGIVKKGDIIGCVETKKRKTSYEMKDVFRSFSYRILRKDNNSTEYEKINPRRVIK